MRIDDLLHSLGQIPEFADHQMWSDPAHSAFATQLDLGHQDTLFDTAAVCDRLILSGF